LVVAVNLGVYGLLMWRLSPGLSTRGRSG
jgi:hypothetical protein